MTDFRIADAFTASLARLTGEEQKAVKTTAFDLQLNPAAPGLRFHKLDKARDKNFWSVRVSSDIRLIVHKTDGSLLLCYVDHHDKAYAWAERRKLETHPRTGAAQFVEIRERVEEVLVQRYVEDEVKRSPAVLPPLFASRDDEELLAYGVPAEWLADVRQATEDSLFNIAEHLPAEAAEALLELATGGTPVAPPWVPADVHPMEHPDAQRRFRVITSQDELERALEFPWDKWTVFLHPAQRELVEWEFHGPARVAGSAGTGKTIVALHRAVHLARSNPDARVLLTTLTEALADSLQHRLRRLIGDTPRLGERLEVRALPAIARRLFERNMGPVTLATDEMIRTSITTALLSLGETSFREHFVLSEWTDVVDAWQLDTWEAYRDVRRLGRKTRLPEARRAALWKVCEHVRDALTAHDVMTEATMLRRLSEHVSHMRQAPFDFVVVDEAQDLSVAQLRFLATMGGADGKGLFFAGDLGQRIFQQPFSWRSLGVDVRGRATTLRVNYRTSQHIRTQADRLLGEEIADVDGNLEVRRGTVSVFEGVPPVILRCSTAEDERDRTAGWLRECVDAGVTPSAIGVIVRSAAEIPRAEAACGLAGLDAMPMTDSVVSAGARATITTMHLAKGLEFRAVAVLACDDGIVPSRERLVAVGDDADLDEVYATERQLLYVACTRARDFLLISGVAPVTDFIDDLTP